MPGRPKGGGKASSQKLTKLQQTEVALDLRRRGYTFRQIAAEMKVTLRVAHRLVMDAFKQHAAQAAENSELLVRLQMERLEAMWRGLAPSAEAGNSRSIEVALRLLERQAKLLGLDAPVKQEVKVSYAELSDEELLAEADRLKLRVDINPLPVSIPLLPLPGEHIQDAEIVPDA